MRVDVPVLIEPPMRSGQVGRPHKRLSVSVTPPELSPLSQKKESHLHAVPVFKDTSAVGSETYAASTTSAVGSNYSLRKQLLVPESFGNCTASQRLAPCANVFVSGSGEERAIDQPLAMSRRRSAVLEAGGSVRGSEAPMDTENMAYACISQKYR